MHILRPKPKRLHLDYESFSGLDLMKVGVSRYARSSSTEVLMAAYKFSGGDMQQWIPAEGEVIPAEFEDGLQDPEIEKWAWNASFEMNLTKHTLGIPVDVVQWRDTMVLAHYLSMPGKLEKVGEIVKLPEEQRKMGRGKALMRKFSFPRKPTKANPKTRLLWSDAFEDWQEYLLYNRNDVEAETAIYHKLERFLPPLEFWEEWHLDQEVNAAGLPINMQMVTNAVRVYTQALNKGQERMNEVTGLANANSGPQLLPWLKEQGYPFNDLKAGHIKRAKERLEDSFTTDFAAIHENRDFYEVLSLRQELSRTSIKKFEALLRAVDRDGMLRYVLQFYGAQRTGRWAGRIFQPQNLPRPERMFEARPDFWAEVVEILDLEAFEIVGINLFDLLASVLRPAAQAPKGYLFIDADLNAIENRVLGWLARCKKILDVFEQGRDPYVDFATYLFKEPYEKLFAEYKAGDKSKRTTAKPGVLGCGYMLGAGQEFENHITGEIEATGLLGYAWNMGVRSFTQEQSALSVETFRREFEEVKDLWYDLERAMRKCIGTGRKTECDRIRFEMDGRVCKMILPNDRPLHYIEPRIEMRKTPWGEKRETITYMGLNEKKQWVRIQTHPGKVTENADQAISRDLLVHGMKLARRRGIDIRLHVHDQIVGLSPEDKAEEQLKVLIECMEERPKWGLDLPLGSNGTVTRVFAKD